MKKIIAILLVTVFSVTTVFSQNISLTDLESQFETMGDDLSGSVAASATTGLVWSDAYIGNFPHFGIGIFTGATIIPVKAFSDLLKVASPDAELPSQLTDLGVPVPAVGIDGRIGGFYLPFDVGVKYARLSKLKLDKVTFDYSLIGGDFRYGLIEDGLVLPSISVGVGFSRLTTDISIGGILEGDFKILSAGSKELYLKNPDLEYGWESNVVEFKAQASKKLFIVTPYLGLNAAYSMTKVGGGITTGVTDGTNSLTQQEIDTIVTAAKAEGQTVPDIDADGFSTYTNTTAWNFKVSGGASINIAVVKIDLGINYDILNSTYGGQLGFRVQL